MNAPRFLCLIVTCFVFSIQTALSETQVVPRPTPFEGKRAKTHVDGQGRTHLLFNQEGNVFYSRMDSGRSEFSKPIQVNSIDKCAAVADLAIGKDGRVHVLFHGNIVFIRQKVQQEGRRVRGTDIKYTFYCRMNDDGTAFEEQRDISGDLWGFDGGCAIAADGQGNVYAFINGTTQPGNELVRNIYMRHSADGGLTFSEPRPVGSSDGVCACCHLNATVNSRGQLMFVYRIAENRMNRDSYVFVSEDQGKTFASKRLDHWELNACPGTVYSFADVGDKTVLSWRTQDQVFLGIPGVEHPIAPGESSNKRRAAAVGSNSKSEILLAWAEGDNFNQPHDLVWQLFDAQGKPIGMEGRKQEAFARWGTMTVYADAQGDFILFY